MRDGMTIRLRPEGHAVVSGTVTDANDGEPVTGATVTVSPAAARPSPPPPPGPTGRT
ncbi:hypothetical protein ACFYPA_28485 [Streptomyces sp. NPDC005775]|uniref:hypothetical protein n=1 Tax=unclassified Streptomyces TaxID=2593676 RepID=UPI0033C72DF7